MEKNYNKYVIDKIINEYSSVNLNEVYASKWDEFKELILTDKIKESEDVTSFYFKSADNSKLVKHKPGQYLPFKIKTDDEKYKNQLRTYSLSMTPNESVYRISVKKVLGGLISTYLHEKLLVGDKIEAMMPCGLFTLKENKNNPLILISGGIGITPLLSMLYEVTMNKNLSRDIYFVQAVQNSINHPFMNDLNQISKISSIKNTVFYSNPLPNDKCYDFKGYIGKYWIKDNLPLNGEFYFCGPPVFMKSIKSSLIELGVSTDNINYEFFGQPSDI